MHAKPFFLIGLTVSLTTLTLLSCRKDKDEEETYDDSVFKQETVMGTAEKALEEEEDGLTLRNYGNTGSCAFAYTASCAAITESSSAFPKTITIDYAGGCMDWHNRLRTGKIFIHLTDSFMNENAVRTVTFENFTINGIGVTGSRITTNNGLNDSNQPIFTRVVDTDVTFNGATYQRNFTQSLTWLSGFDTPACYDNIWSVSGSGVVVRPNGLSIARATSSPLIIDFSCPHITQGSIEIYSLQGTWTIDYGDGNCDNDATVTRPNGVIVYVEL